MDKINIANLTGIPDTNFGGSLCINSLVTESKKTHSLDNDIDTIINSQKEKIKKKKRAYKKQLLICVDKMKEANMINKTDVIYQLPKYVFDCPEYDIDECIEYVHSQLRKRNIDTTSKENTIFISWIYSSCHQKNT